MSQKACIITYGCQMNKYDSEVISGLLEKESYLLTDVPEDADLILINTCSVRQHAEQRVFSKLGVVSLLKKENPYLLIGICGCMAERLGSVLLKRFPALDLVIGPNNIDYLSDLLKRVKRGERGVSIGSNRALQTEVDSYVDRGVTSGINKLTSFVPISFGCNNFCSYCIVPYVRGKQRDRKQEDIIREIRDLVNSGCIEVTLLGQNVSSYRSQATSFVDLLTNVNDINGLRRIRFITSHPRDVHDKLIEAVQRLDKVCEHFHLPIQAGSDKILGLMQRGYTVQTYRQLIDKIKTQIPNVSITTDLIIGFPGEGQQEFKETISLVKELKFDSAFIFKYSPREGTPAVLLTEQIDEQIKTERVRELISIQKEITRQRNYELIGTTQEVLVEGIDPKDADSSVLGRTRTDKVISLQGKRGLIGQIVMITIESAEKGLLRGVQI